MQDFVCRGGEFYMVDQDDGNKVVYLRDVNTGQLIRPVWDEWSWKANNQIPVNPSEPPPTIDIPNNPIPIVDNPVVAADRLVGVPVLIAEGVNPIGMSYWRNINQWVGRDFLECFLSVNDELWVYSIDFRTLKVIGKRSLNIHHTGEGCSFSALHADELYVPSSRQIEVRNTQNGGVHVLWYADNYNLWQPHVSYDESAVSASIENSNWEITRWGIIKDGKVRFFDLTGGTPDECQIDKSGEWLICKEGNDNIIYHLKDGSKAIIPNEDGALGHSDCGFGIALGENDYSQLAGACDMIDFTNGYSRKNIYSTGIWNMGYVSFTNAKPNVPLFQQKCLITTPYDLISVQLDGSKAGRKVCSHGYNGNDYEARPKANLCPNGKYAAYTVEDKAYIVGIPEW